jgi:hypothetical protein
VAGVGPLFRDPVARRDEKAFPDAQMFPHTYELRPTDDGWLVIVDNKQLAHCKTLPEANLALIHAHAKHSSARID